jgi:hypothetical protein
LLFGKAFKNPKVLVSLFQKRSPADKHRRRHTKKLPKAFKGFRKKSTKETALKSGILPAQRKDQTPGN